MRLRLLIILAMSIILSFSAYAVTSSEVLKAHTNYSYAGYYGGYGIAGHSYIPQAGVYEQRTASIAAGYRYPLVSDLDKNGQNELIVMEHYSNSDYAVSLFHEGSVFSLEPIDQILIGGGALNYSNPVVTDINGDTYPEIVMMNNNNPTQIIIINYNNSVFNYSYTSVKDMTSSPCNHLDGTPIISCYDTGECAFMLPRDDGGNIGLCVGIFNSTKVIDVVSVTGLTGINQCAPNIPYITKADYDGDSVQEYITSFLDVTSVATDDYVRIVYFNLNGSKNVSVERTISRDLGNRYSWTGSRNCYDSFIYGGDVVAATGQMGITSPSVYDYDGFASNGMETVIAFMVGHEQWEMIAYDKNGNEKDDFPETEYSEGQILSNIVRADAFPDGKTSEAAMDFCVMGANSDTDNLILTCGSLVGSYGYSNSFPTYSDTLEFTIELPYDLIGEAGNYGSMISAVSASDLASRGNNLDEFFLGAYGVFTLADDAGVNDDVPYLPYSSVTGFASGSLCAVSGECKLQLVYAPDISDATWISVDFQKNGNEDYIGLTSSAAIYLDDGYVNMPGKIASYYIDPWPSGQIYKNGTQVAFLVSCNDETLGYDIDSDLVSRKVEMYLNDDNYQTTGWSTNSSANVNITGILTANKTGTYTMRISCQDSVNMLESDIDSVDLSFTVALEGVRYGEGGGGSSTVTRKSVV